MQVEHGTASSLQNLARRFFRFAQDSNDTTQAWHLVDDRLDTFYGATLEVPLKDKNVPYFYISFQHTNVGNHTYNDWLTKDVDFDFYIPYDLHAKNSEGHIHHNYQGETFNANKIEILSWNRVRKISFDSHYGDSEDIINPFCDTGEFLAVGLHTLFDENLWMCEQPQITCEREAREQKNRQNLAPARRYWYSYGRGEEDVDIPSFPSVGCPWFTLSDKNKVEFDCKHMEYWFTKTDYSATITYRVVRPKDWQTAYQSMSFGKLECVDDASYKFPLFVAGGTGALKQDVYVFGRSTGGPPTHTEGNVYTLDIKNIALSNGNLLNPCKFNKSEVSNFRILSPEGIWRDIFSWEQNATIVHYFSCGAIYKWGYPLDEPFRLGSNSTYHSAFPILTDYQYTTDSHRAKEKLFDPYHISTPFTRVITYLNDKRDNQENGIYGFLPSNYMSWSKSLPSGEVTIGGKKYLSIPNGWDERLQKYPHHTGEVVNEEWDNDTVMRRMEQPMSNKFTVKMLIPLEEGA